MDPAQYVGQLAQFSSVSGLADMNKNDRLAHGVAARQPGARRRRAHRPHGDRRRQRGLSARRRGRRRHRDAGRWSMCPPARRPCSSWSRTRPARWSRPQALEQHQGPARLHAGTARTDAGAQRAAGALQDRSHRQGRRQERIPQHQRRGPAFRASRSTRPPARSMLDTDTLGEIAMSDVERVL